jgi:beta-N-acetylhexosaminidase
MRALEAGERGGAILFSRNLTHDPMQCAELSGAIASAAPSDSPPLVSIDQEGGRVARLKAPVLELPPMRTFGDEGDLALAYEAARALASQLAALGVTMSFAPVLDVNTRAENPVIGNRAFGDDAKVVSELGRRWAEGLRDGGVLACGKHYPGHGDAAKDSHFELPVISLDEGTLHDIHVKPFLECGATLPAIMTAHVIYPAFDRDFPATLSRVTLDRLRASFDGCIVSDDLEMKAIADRWTVEESAVRAVEAGCDVLLVCRSEELQERVVTALAKRMKESDEFAAKVERAHSRFVSMRRKVPSRPVTTRAGFDEASRLAADVAPKIAQRLVGRT